MIGFEDDYEELEEYSKYNRMIFGEWLFFAFGLEPKTLLGNYLGNTVHFSNRSTMKDFAFDLLENGETIFRLSERYRKQFNLTSSEVI